MGDKTYRPLGRRSEKLAGSKGSSSGESDLRGYFEKENIHNLETIVDGASLALQYFIPIPDGLNTVIAITKKLYEHRETIVKTVDNISSTWSSNDDLEQKITDTIVHLADATIEVTEKEVVNALTSDASKHILDMADKNDMLGKLSKELSVRGIPVNVRNFVEDALQEEIGSMIERATK